MTGGGFWQEGQAGDDAHVLLAAAVHELRQLPYSELVDRAGRMTREQVVGLDGEALERRTLICRQLRGGEEQLRITVQVSAPGLRGRWSPAEELIIATPDGHFHREWTLANSSEERRRYVIPTAWIVAGTALSALVLLAWWLFAPK